MEIQKMRRKQKNAINGTIQLPGKSHSNTMVTTEFLGINKMTSESLISFTSKDRKSTSEMNKECNVKKRFHDEWNTTSKSNMHNELSDQTEVTVRIENKQDEIKKMDETYELSEPETPTLRRIIRKKQNTNKNNLNTKSGKKPLKVRFKESLLGKSLPDVVTKVNSKRNILMSSISAFNKQRNSVSNESGSTVDPKSPAVKKVPNFAEIHKKMFGKLESVVDAKKRLKSRHTALTTVVTNKSTSLKINSKHKDRSEFKIRKQEATECILRNSVQSTRSKIQQQSRAILKGVRTNRRFELQMKARNLTL